MTRRKNKNKNEYYLDTTKQIKIWFSTNSDIFLPTENILRFLKTILLNKDAKFSFIYSADLLSKKALTELHSFCQQFNVSAIDIKEIISQEEENNDFSEKKLNKTILELLDAIKTTKTISFTAIASDLVRLKKEVLKLGIYTDTDAVTDFTTLGKKHPVEAGFLSAVFMSDDGLITNNDFIAIAQDNKNNEYIPEAFAALKTIQEFSLNGFDRFSLKQIDKSKGKICKIIPKIACTTKGMFSQYDILDIMLKIYVNSDNKDSISFFRFLHFIETNTTEKSLGEKILKRVLDSDQFESLIEILKDRYEVKDTQEIYNFIRIEFVKELVTHLAGPGAFSHLFSKLAKEGDINRFTLTNNKLDKIISFQGDKIILEDGKELDRNGDNTWLDHAENKNSILLNDDGAQILKQEIIAYLINNINKDDPRRDYIFEQIFKFEEIYRTFINKQNEKLKNDACPNIYSAKDAISIKLTDEKFSIDAESNDEEQIVIKNIVKGIKDSAEGKIGIVPIFMEHHWTGMIFKQNSSLNLEVVFVDSLGKNFTSYHSEVITQTIKQQSNDSFTILNAVDLGFEIKANEADCGISVIDDIVDIALIVAGAEMKDEL